MAGPYHQRNSKTDFMSVFGIFSFVVIVLVVIVNSSSSISTPISTVRPTLSPKIEKVIMTNWETSIIADEYNHWIIFDIHNDNDYDVKDFTIKCDFFAASGTWIDSTSRTVYERISAHSNWRVPPVNYNSDINLAASRGYYNYKAAHSFNMGRANSQSKQISCQLVDYKIG